MKYCSFDLLLPHAVSKSFLLPSWNYLKSTLLLLFLSSNYSAFYYGSSTSIGTRNVWIAHMLRVILKRLLLHSSLSSYCNIYAVLQGSLPYDACASCFLGGSTCFQSTLFFATDL